MISEIGKIIERVFYVCVQLFSFKLLTGLVSENNTIG